MELIMTIHAYISKQINNVKGNEMSICMIPFTGEAEGSYFNGKVLGEGVDTQKIYNKDNVQLSARYMLEGEDLKGNKCNVFIENNGTSLDNCIPKIVTDSPDLQFLEEANLVANVIPNEHGVDVKIYNNDETGRI